ncbi:MAG: response regulator transcription factor [Acidobacteriia bacterium]|nr:response regulator transcription factor [Terriglobia bacterium]
MRILVAEDDQPLAEFLKDRLQQEHFTVEVVSDGLEARRRAESQLFDLLILDLGLPGESGLGVLQHIRERKPDLPVLIVTGDTPVDARVRGLDAGADDYLGKPFSFAELAARVRALLRRASRPVSTHLQVEDLELDRVERKVQRAGRPIELTPKEFALLEFLMQHAGQPVSRALFVEQVWGMKGETLTNVVDVYINYVRHKVDEGFPRHLIRTVRGVGYQIGESS